MLDTYWKHLRACAAEARAGLNAGRSPLYVIERRGTPEAWGGLALVAASEPVPDGWSLLTGERVPDRPAAEIADWLHRMRPCICGPD